MENKELDAILGRRTLHGDGRLGDDGTRAIDQLILLLMSKDITANKEANG